MPSGVLVQHDLPITSKFYIYNYQHLPSTRIDLLYHTYISALHSKHYRI